MPFNLERFKIDFINGIKSGHYKNNNLRNSIGLSIESIKEEIIDGSRKKVSLSF